MYRDCQEGSGGRSESVYVRETGKGQSLKEPWMGITCICENMSGTCVACVSSLICNTFCISVHGKACSQLSVLHP